MGEYRVAKEPDFGERRATVQVSINIDYPVVNPAQRDRHGAKVGSRSGQPHRREKLRVYRGWQLALGPEALDEKAGPTLIGTAVYRLILERLRYEGYPVRVREGNDTRPGGA